MKVRLHKFIADCGVTSRRKAEGLIIQGRVKLNGDTVTILGTKIDPAHDVVYLDGTVVDPKTVNKVYLLLNKPRGYMCTVSDPEGRETVMDLCREISERIYPVGRLDYLSEGLLVMTNDGEIANTIMHPSNKIRKVYEVKVFGTVTLPILKQLRGGVKIDNYFVKPVSVRIIKQLPTKTWLEFQLEDGKNREIRNICEECGITVDKLRRVAIGEIVLTGIKPGTYKSVSKRQLLNGILGEKQNGKLKNYVSAKKTVNIRKKGPQQGTSADDRIFSRFRKDIYYQSVTQDQNQDQEQNKKI